MVFSAFERMVAMRYLRARRQEGFISVIAGFSLLGIALGVATLIIVMSVMNGFRAELLGRILGLNGHITIYARAAQHIPDYEMLVNRIKGMRDVVAVAPQVQGQALATANGVAGPALIRGIVPKAVAVPSGEITVIEPPIETPSRRASRSPTSTPSPPKSARDPATM